MPLWPTGGNPQQQKRSRSRTELCFCDRTKALFHYEAFQNVESNDSGLTLLSKEQAAEKITHGVCSSDLNRIKMFMPRFPTTVSKLTTRMVRSRGNLSSGFPVKLVRINSASWV